MSELLEVTQADREAAAQFSERIVGKTNGRDQIARCRAGQEDATYLVQAFVAHRLAGRAAALEEAKALVEKRASASRLSFGRAVEARNDEHQTRFAVAAREAEETADAIRAIASAGALKAQTVALERDAVAQVMGAALPTEYDWQHIRQASEVFVERLTALHTGADKQEDSDGPPSTAADQGRATSDTGGDAGAGAVGTERREAIETLTKFAQRLKACPDDTPDSAYASIESDHGEVRAIRAAILALTTSPRVDEGRAREALADAAANLGYPLSAEAISRGDIATRINARVALEAIRILALATTPADPRVGKIEAGLEAAKKALRPFAFIADTETDTPDNESVFVNVSRCRDARSTLSQIEDRI